MQRLALLLATALIALAGVVLAVQLPPQSINDIMITRVIPSANAIRNGLDDIASREGGWDDARQGATALIQSAHALSMSRARQGARTATPLEALIGSDLGAWSAMIGGMRSASEKIMAAADAKDADAMAVAAADLTRSCDNCHARFRRAPQSPAPCPYSAQPARLELSQSGFPSNWSFEGGLAVFQVTPSACTSVSNDAAFRPCRFAPAPASAACRSISEADAPTGATFTLVAGDYELYGGVRLCDGNCNLLDPPIDECRVRFTIKPDETLYAHVSRASGKASCEVTATKP